MMMLQTSGPALTRTLLASLKVDCINTAAQCHVDAVYIICCYLNTVSAICHVNCNPSDLRLVHNLRWPLVQLTVYDYRRESKGTVTLEQYGC